MQIKKARRRIFFFVGGRELFLSPQDFEKTAGVWPKVRGVYRRLTGINLPAVSLFVPAFGALAAFAGLAYSGVRMQIERWPRLW